MNVKLLVGDGRDIIMTKNKQILTHNISSKKWPHDDTFKSQKVTISDKKVHIFYQVYNYKLQFPLM